MTGPETEPAELPTGISNPVDALEFHSRDPTVIQFHFSSVHVTGVCVVGAGGFDLGASVVTDFRRDDNMSTVRRCSQH